MKLPKDNLAYNTRDQLQSLAINAGERTNIITLSQLKSVWKSWGSVIITI